MCANGVLKSLIKRDDTFCRLSYSDNLTSDPFSLENALVLPASSIIVKVSTTVNGLQITRGTDSHLFEALQYGFSSSCWWPALDYDVLATPAQEDHQFQLQVGCRISPEIVVDGIRSLPESGLAVKEISWVLLDLEICSDKGAKDVKTLLEIMEHQMVSLMLHLDSAYPFAFSFHARHLLKQKYWFIRRNADLIDSSKDHLQSLGIAVVSRSEILLRNLLLLQTWAVSEYTCVKIMKAFDCKKKPKKICTEIPSSLTAVPNEDIDVKALPFCLQFFNIPSVVQDLAKKGGRA